MNAAHFSGVIRNALEDALGRQIDFDKVYFSVFPLPGFSLEKVTIQEDPSYGLEPFAYAPSLQARLRIDRLLLGQIRFSSLHLTDPRLNLVKRSDGTWNVVDLIGRLSTPSRIPLNLLPAISITSGRIDFKFGTRKTILYIVDSDVSVYRVQSGKIITEFSGSPARTDRAGNGFGHLRGTVNWFVGPPEATANQLEADVTLDPSNLSEITTLIEGHDIGVHGTIGSTAHIEGPATALRVNGQLQLGDVHRWDLMPSSGDDWRINYSGALDLVSQIFTLQTIPGAAGEAVPAALRVRVKQLLTKPAWSVFLTLTQAPLQDMLPLGRHMGLALPAGLQLSGAVDGVVSYSNSNGLAGGVAVTNAAATLPNVPPARAAVANVTISSNNVHMDPAILQVGVGGTLRAGGDYFPSTQHLIASVSADAFPISALKSTIQAWFGAADALSIWSDGDVTGQFAYEYREPKRDAPPAQPAAWSGQFQFSNATFHIPGLGLPLKHAQGRASFNTSNFDLPHFSAVLAQQPFTGSYRYNLAAKHPEHVHFELPTADLAQLDAALAPALEDQSFLSRLAFTRRSIPTWLASRNVDGDAVIGRFSVEGNDLGPLSTRFIWEGTKLQLTNLQLRTPQAILKASGAADLAAHSPQYRFSATVTDFPWGGGLLSANGRFQTAGRGDSSLRNLRANGSFTGKDITLAANSAFNTVSGLFSFSFANGWPSLQLENVQAFQEDDNWTGEGSTRSDGKLIVDLAHEGRQLHVVSALIPESPSAVAIPQTGSTASR